MIPKSRYVPKQMNGPVINAEAEAVEVEFSDAEAIAEYLYDLSIDTAQETELENIGRIIGYLRPLVPEGFNAENILLLGPVPLEIDPELGLAVTGTEVGGHLSTIQTSDSYFMDLGTYRKILGKMAILKRYGITLQSIDEIVSLVSDDYEIDFAENNDIFVSFGSPIGYKNLWMLTQIFYRIATEPQVLITSAED